MNILLLILSCDFLISDILIFFATSSICFFHILYLYLHYVHVFLYVLEDGEHIYNRYLKVLINNFIIYLISGIISTDWFFFGSQIKFLFFICLVIFFIRWKTYNFKVAKSEFYFISLKMVKCGPHFRTLILWIFF